jgi:hypothetical protein
MSKCKAYMCKHGCMIPQDCPEDDEPSEGAPSESAGPVSAFPLATGSLPVPGAEAFIAQLRDRLESARSLTKSPLDAHNREHYEGIVWAWDDIMPELGHLLGVPNVRQPEENRPA